MDILKLYITELLNLITDINNGRIPYDNQVKDFKDQINWLIEHPEVIEHNSRLAFHPWLFQERLNIKHADKKNADFIKSPFIGIFNTTGSIFSVSVPINKFEQKIQNYHRNINLDPTDGTEPINEEPRLSPDNLKLFIDHSRFGSAFGVCIDVNTNRGCINLILSLPESFDINTLEPITSYAELCYHLNEFKINENEQFNFLNEKKLEKTKQYRYIDFFKGLDINYYGDSNDGNAFKYNSISFDVKDFNINNIPIFNFIKQKIPNQCYINSKDTYGNYVPMTEEEQLAILLEPSQDQPEEIIDYNFVPFNKNNIKWECKIFIVKFFMMI